MNSKQLAIIFCLLLHSKVGITQPLPRSENVPGGLVIVPLSYTERPNAFYIERPVMVIGHTGNWQAIIGIPLNAEPGSYHLKVSVNGDESIHHFEISKKEYKAQYLTIDNKRQVNPSPQDLERIQQEQELISKAKATWRDTETVPVNLSIPVEGIYSSPFGLRRFFNNEPRRPHSGLDIAAVESTQIKAPAAGYVVNTGEYFFNGNTVFIDHGQGMITMYCHMKNINVKEGQEVKHGETIGTVGKTGRATGAHLHWSVILNQTAVNPALFLEVPSAN